MVHLTSTDPVKSCPIVLNIPIIFQSIVEISAGIEVSPACSDVAVQFEGVTTEVGQLKLIYH